MRFSLIIDSQLFEVGKILATVEGVDRLGHHCLLAEMEKILVATEHVDPNREGLKLLLV